MGKLIQSAMAHHQDYHQTTLGVLTYFNLAFRQVLEQNCLGSPYNLHGELHRVRMFLLLLLHFNRCH